MQRNNNDLTFLVGNIAVTFKAADLKYYMVGRGYPDYDESIEQTAPGYLITIAYPDDKNRVKSIWSEKALASIGLVLKKEGDEIIAAFNDKNYQVAVDKLNPGSKNDVVTVLSHPSTRVALNSNIQTILRLEIKKENVHLFSLKDVIIKLSIRSTTSTDYSSYYSITLISKDGFYIGRHDTIPKTAGDLVLKALKVSNFNLAMKILKEVGGIQSRTMFREEFQEIISTIKTYSEEKSLNRVLIYKGSKDPQSILSRLPSDVLNIIMKEANLSPNTSVNPMIETGKRLDDMKAELDKKIISKTNDFIKAYKGRVRSFFTGSAESRQLVIQLQKILDSDAQPKYPSIRSTLYKYIDQFLGSGNNDESEYKKSAAIKLLVECELLRYNDVYPETLKNDNDKFRLPEKKR